MIFGVLDSQCNCLLLLGSHLILWINLLNRRYLLSIRHFLKIRHILVIILKIHLCIIGRPCRPLLIPVIHLIVFRHLLNSRHLMKRSNLLELIYIYMVGINAVGDKMHLNMSMFSTQALIWGHHKIRIELSQKKKLNSLVHNSLFELWTGITHFFTFLVKHLCSFISLILGCCSKNSIFRSYI